MENKPIHVSREGKIVGQFSQEEVKTHLSSGLLMQTDLAWQEGMHEWKPINEIIGHGGTVSGIPPALPPQLGNESTIQSILNVSSPSDSIQGLSQASGKGSTSTKYIIVACVGLCCVMCAVIGVVIPDKYQLPDEDNLGIGGSEGTDTKSETTESKWFQGWNLHNATLAEWVKSSYRNKLATAGDWLVVSKWKGALNSTDDFDRLKVKAEMLVEAVDGVATADSNLNESLTAKEIAASILTLSNDLGP